MESDAKEVQPTFNTKPPIEDLKERRDSAASSDGNSSGTDVEANQGGTGFLYTLSHLSPLPINPECRQHSDIPRITHSHFFFVFSSHNKNYLQLMK